ncbi:cytochrome c [Oscillochloris sp. ZM17-4]|uniref:c-type cytochrome n=1 Tax=Oscillochloris sp. ZM17-4 TaxID=2866714 RepID=UPI001C731FDC|nr:cytochrome c [Oscillochloris sp. ZM17-4]MBX0329082.1 cytochrome c [Oscillochloris sp. ZM17-4]
MRQIIFILMLITLAACGAPAAPVDPVAAGGRAFTIQCGGCHAISEVGSAALGPRLDAMVARANATPDPAAWLRMSITNPAAEIAPGYRPGLMPISYGQSLSPAELDALVAYMLKVGG